MSRPHLFCIKGVFRDCDCGRCARRSPVVAHFLCVLGGALAVAFAGRFGKILTQRAPYFHAYKSGSQQRDMHKIGQCRFCVGVWVAVWCGSLTA